MRMKSLVALALLASVTAANAAGLGGPTGPVGVAPYNVNANGAAAGANSAPVVQALDQPVSSANTTIPISVNSSSAVQVLAHSGTKVTYVTHWFFLVAGAVNFKWVYGTGTNCGTGQADLTGSMPLAVAGSGGSPGNGAAAILVVPSGQDLCAKPDTAVQIGGELAYQQR